MKTQREEDTLSTLIRGLSTHFERTGYLMRELDRNCNEAIHMITEKEAELNTSGYRRESAHSEECALFTRQTRGNCFEFGREGHFK